MTRLIILGTAAAVSDEQHENTHLALIGEERLALIDCVGRTAVRLHALGVDLTHQLTDLILTHFHPDHVSGVPSLLMTSWLEGRTQALNIYGLPYTLDRLQTMMGLYRWDTWPNFYPVNFVPIPETPMSLVMACAEWRIHASPVQHIVPTVGLRITPAHGRIVAYSCDTEPSPAVVELAQQADVLIHEAAGRSFGHSSAAQAGQVAAEAGAGELLLIHYPPKIDAAQWESEARQSFNGPVSLAQDWMEIPL